MPLIDYENLSDEQKELVSKMYANLTNLAEFAYNFDDKGGYHGREKMKLKEKKAPEPKPDSKIEKEQPKPAPKRKRTRRKTK